MSTNTMRERRSDAVAKSMGEYLLKGYRMLATSCGMCNNVLLQDRDGLTLCINCQDSERGVKESEAIVNLKDGLEKIADATLVDTDAVEVVLMMEITRATRALENLVPGTDLQHKQVYIRHIRECAETIKALRSIK